MKINLLISQNNETKAMSLELETEGINTVEALKNRIFKITGLPVENQTLLFSGRALIDKDELVSKNMSIVTCVVRNLPEQFSFIPPADDSKIGDPTLVDKKNGFVAIKNRKLDLNISWHFSAYLIAKIRNKSHKYMNCHIILTNEDSLSEDVKAASKGQTDVHRIICVLGTGHMTTLDLEINPKTGEKSCVILDSIDGEASSTKKIISEFLEHEHYNTHLFYSPVENKDSSSVSKTLYLQKDWNSCLYFAIHFAVQAAKTAELHQLCRDHQQNNNTNAHPTTSIHKLPWDVLPHRFFKHAQSQTVYNYLSANCKMKPKAKHDGAIVNERTSSFFIDKAEKLIKEDKNHLGLYADAEKLGTKIWTRTFRY